MKPSISLWFGCVALLAVSGCRRAEHSPPVPVRSAARTIASSAPPASPAAPREEPAAQVVRAWSDALDRHDLRKLEELYGKTVRFYGRTQSKTAVLAAKRAALAKQPTFYQEIIGQISLTPLGGGNVSASFVKKSGSSDEFSVISARLILAPTDGGFVIVEEADEANLQSK